MAKTFSCPRCEKDFQGIPETENGSLCKKCLADSARANFCAVDPLASQVGGDHYKKMAIQPVEYIHANGIPFIEGCVIKYMSRWRDKNGIDDLKKAKHFIDLLIALEEQKRLVGSGSGSGKESPSKYRPGFDATNVGPKTGFE